MTAARDNREAIARDIAARRGATLVPPYDDALVIAGQGTAGREIVEDLAAIGLAPEVVLVSASGGGLTAGIALAVKARAPAARVYTAEPAGFDDHARSFRSGRREVEPGGNRNDLRRADGANAGRAHLRHQPFAGRGGGRGNRCARSPRRSPSRSAN